MNKNYRSLTDVEIEQLQLQGCCAENWKHVQVAELFAPDNLFQVSFYGQVRLGVFDDELEISDRVRRRAGIRNAELRNVTVGDNCLIENIGSYISDYEIGNGCYISQVGVMEITGKTRFGNGVEIHVLQEVGDDLTITLHQELTAQEVYTAVNYPEWNRNVLKRLIRNEYAPAYTGTIGNSVRIVNVGEVCDTSIGDGTEVNGAVSLLKLTIDSSIDYPVYIGVGCMIRSSIISFGAEVTGGAKVLDCFVGQGTHIGMGFTATSSVFFANCYMDNGEACSVVAGPFTVSHHKSTLLIGCMLSFANLGSGTNMSNHMYKIGPVHYGVMERGCKTASNAHLVWPARIGAFSMVMGKLGKHIDSTMFPFSYLFGEGNEVYLVPGANSMTLGTFRDMLKWPERDVRKKGYKFDLISSYSVLNPITISNVKKGLDILRSIRFGQPEEEVYTYEGMRIKRKALEKGIALYEKLMILFWGEYCLRYLYKYEYCGEMLYFDGSEPSDFDAGWDDALGLLIPHSALSAIVDELTNCEFATLTAFYIELNFVLNDYESYLRAWQESEEGLGSGRIWAYADRYPEMLSELQASILADLEKEKELGDVPVTYAEKVTEQVTSYMEEKKKWAQTVLSLIKEKHQE